MPSYVMCPRCSYRNTRTGGRRKCQGCGASLPKRRVPVHARTLRDDSYAVYEAVNASLHASGHSGEWTPDCCGVCGKPPSTARHMDRDHDHVTGKPRGLACPGNSGCNALMPRQLDLARARLIVAYLERVEAFYAERVTDRV